MRVLGIAGSLRLASYNRALLAAAAQVAPPPMTIEPFDLASIPLYNADLDTDEQRHQAANRKTPPLFRATASSWVAGLASRWPP